MKIFKKKWYSTATYRPVHLQMFTYGDNCDTASYNVVRYLWAVTDVQWSLSNPQPGNSDPIVVRNILGLL